MSGLSQFQIPPWCGRGVMSTRRKHRALNGITQGDVNLRRAGGELNMIRGLQWEGWKSSRESEGTEETIRERKGTTKIQKTEKLLHCRVVHCHSCSPGSFFKDVFKLSLVFLCQNEMREAHLLVRPS